jgi:Rod binding domain-containing protein
MPSFAPTTSIAPSAGIQPGDDALFGRARKAGPASGNADFASVMGKMTRKGDESPEQFSRRSAETLVSIAFVQPILKKLRETNHAAPPFAPTDGEKQFRSLADAELAQRIVHSSNFPLVDRIADQLITKAKGRAGRTDAPGAASSSQLPDIPWSQP